MPVQGPAGCPQEVQVLEVHVWHEKGEAADIQVQNV